MSNYVLVSADTVLPELPEIRPEDRAIKPLSCEAMDAIATAAPEAAAEMLAALRDVATRGGWPGLWASSCVSALDAAISRAGPTMSADVAQSVDDFWRSQK